MRLHYRRIGQFVLRAQFACDTVPIGPGGLPVANRKPRVSCAGGDLLFSFRYIEEKTCFESWVPSPE